MSKYRLTVPRFEHPAGTIVYLSSKCDYGCANDDSRYTGVPHTSVTLNETGDYPFFTVPIHQLEEIHDGQEESRV